MPQVIKIGAYVIFFWLDEGRPLEPIHVHIAEGVSGKRHQGVADTIRESRSGQSTFGDTRR